jgi:tetratricopeptide (TPR) repeat protein
MAYDPADLGGFLPRIEELAADPDRHTAVPASQWLSHARENVGDLAGAVEAASHALALASDDDGPWQSAILRTQLAQLEMHLGLRQDASDHARAALTVMRRLGATDDEVQLRALLGLCAVADGRLEDAQWELDQIDEIDSSETIFGGITVRRIGRAELALARGDRAAGLRLYREAAAEMRELQLPGIPRTGLEPWALFGDATALTAHAYFAPDGDLAQGRELYRHCRAHALRTLDPANERLDYPVTGMGLFGLGAWGLLRREMAVDDAVRLLALADRFAYNRTIPTMAWERIVPHAEAAAPGGIAAASADYGDDRPPDLLLQARRAVERSAD